MHAVILGHTAPRGRWSLNGSAMATKGDVALQRSNSGRRCRAALLPRLVSRHGGVGGVCFIFFTSNRFQISVCAGRSGRGRNLCREGDFFVLCGLVRKPNPFEGNGWICRLACHNHAHVTPLFSLTPPAPLIARPCAFTQILQSLRPADPRPTRLDFLQPRARAVIDSNTPRRLPAVPIER